MKYLTTVVFFFCCLLSETIQGQQTWTLDECVSYAIQNNLQVKDFEYSEQANKEDYRQSIRNLLPSVSAFSNYRINFGRSVDPNTNSFVNTEFVSNNYSLDAQIDLFQGFQKVNTIKATKFLYQASYEETLHQKYLLAFRVMSAFYDIQFMKGLLAISKEQVQVSEENYNLVKRQVELGQKAKADLYEAESAWLADQLLVTQSENNLEAAKLALMQEMNLNEDRTITVVDLGIEKSSSVETVEKNEDSIFSAAQTVVPIIKAQELRIQAAKKQLAATRGALYPSFVFSAGYSSRYVDNNLNSDTGELIPFNTQIKDNAAQFVGVSLRIPISNGWSSRSRVKQQKVAMMRAENNYNIQKQETYQIIQQLVQDGNALQREYEQSNLRRDSQQVAFDIAQKRYEKGLISIIELNQSKNLLANAQNEFLQVRLRSKINKSTLDFYRGLPVFNIKRVQ